MSVQVLHAFIDEAGQRARSPVSTSDFAMAAAVIVQEHLVSPAQLLTQLRVDLGRQPGDTPHWQNLKDSGPISLASDSRPATTDVVAQLDGAE